MNIAVKLAYLQKLRVIVFVLCPWYPDPYADSSILYRNQHVASGTRIPSLLIFPNFLHFYPVFSGGNLNTVQLQGITATTTHI